MATTHTRSAARLMMAPSVIALFIWMIVPLALTLWFSTLRYTFYDPLTPFIGIENYTYFLTDPRFISAFQNTLILVAGVLCITVIGGTLIALLLDQQFFGQSPVRLLVLAPFFVMPTVAALVWKNMMMNPVYGVIAQGLTAIGLPPIDWLTNYPLLSIIIIVAWQWLPFATLILLTSLQSLSEDQKEAAEMDGAKALSIFWYITLPHMKRAITVVILIQTIFLLSVYAEIFVTTGGGVSSSNLPFLIASIISLEGDVGTASAGGIVAVVLANIVSIFLVRLVGKNLEA
ncbi:carbohydrate ABC transporter permease [Aureimonas phyllosphaerae]|uniref:Sorbitol/mannitol transport system permease protein n=1 Tax=Aureimonas phyllosphaerae TaxID=1166078 RepID=A0A7W6FU64_9HYPH|nr:sugar ABC transporter permease [Aureimonas phyllosphaerae]MBB3935475.1 sorbitol/mannitol transport system permease protein [Aureimonas phyllosphaerae]MBB3959483.1 sorbitol/mannitol transport system permease protein [Aureimonas phyllosphaerae]SFF11109.1 sorbitol ABC transporter membrane protein /mannitol ABC transporter membrane protein [Aureimonas phyllosphaerae]